MLGLRPRILLLLGSLLLLALVPLSWAITTYSRVTLASVREHHARALGRAVAAQVVEAWQHRDAQSLTGLLRAEVGSEGVEAIELRDAQGAQLAATGNAEVLTQLAALPAQSGESTRPLRLGTMRALVVSLPSALGSVRAVVRTDLEATQAAPLMRLLTLYVGVVGLALLVATYFSLSRSVVRPLGEMAAAAQRVAAGSRRADFPEKGPPELAMLGRSLRTMTEHLVNEEQALRRKIEEVEQATRRLAEAQERLVRSERLASVGKLAAGLAHEVGNPLAAILGLQELLLAGGSTAEEERDFLQRMKRETERIHRILRDLLQFARPTAYGGPEGTNPAGDVASAIEDTLALLRPQKTMKTLKLELRVDDGLPAVGLGNEQLVQVLLNLLLNAADACAGSGTLRVQARRTPSGVWLCVEDDGPGVPEAVRARLFEPFVTTKEVGKGTGLGLAVCRGLIEAAGGTIQLDEAHGPGARFVVELPEATFSPA